MKTTQLQAVTFPGGVSFTKGKQAMIETLFQPIQGKTAFGYYAHKRGGSKAYFYDMQGNLLFGMVAKGGNVQFGTATSEGRFWPCLDNQQAELLGLEPGDWRTREQIAREVLA